MKWLLLNTDYMNFVHWLYNQYPKLKEQTYDRQMKARNKSLFAIADFYSRNLIKLGCEAYDIHVNNEFMQKAWARENNIKINFSLVKIFQKVVHYSHQKMRLPVLPLLDSSKCRSPEWLYPILKAQIAKYQPDVILNFDMISLDAAILRRMIPKNSVLIGETDAAFPADRPEDYHHYDLVRCSLPTHVSYFRDLGVKCIPYKFAFEADLLDEIHQPSNRDISLSFVGSLSHAHSDRLKWLEQLCEKTEIKIWAPTIEHLPLGSPIRERYVGQAWGQDFFGILSRSKITVNHQINCAGNYADNMRLFEATGMGALLITDYKDNLEEFFKSGEEVVTYHTSDECINLIEFYLEHEKERATIALAGQKHTLHEHTYYHRMQEFVDIVAPILEQRSK